MLAAQMNLCNCSAMAWFSTLSANFEFNTFILPNQYIAPIAIAQNAITITVGTNAQEIALFECTKLARSM